MTLKNFVIPRCFTLFVLTMLSCNNAFASEENGFFWPIGCTPGIDCAGGHFRIGYPDVSASGKSFSCTPPGYKGHQGTDIVVSSVEQEVPVLAAADGVIRWFEDGLYDRCPTAGQRDCEESKKSRLPHSPDATLGFNAGNYLMIEHTFGNTRYMTLYAHLGKGSIQVKSGQRVHRGEQIAFVGSSGNAQIPHLHFGVYRDEGKFFRPVDPWKGLCNTSSEGLWAFQPPYRQQDDGSSHEDLRADGFHTQRGAIQFPL